MNDVAFISLSQGKQAIVDNQCFPMVSQYKWSFAPSLHRSQVSYAARHSANERIYLHRFIWTTIVGPIPQDKMLDHINGNGLDNRLCNLRLVMKGENTSNSYKRRNSLTSSRYVGVCWNKHNKMWQAQINKNGKRRHIGSYFSEDEAHQAYLEAKERQEVKA